MDFLSMKYLQRIGFITCLTLTLHSMMFFTSKMVDAEDGASKEEALYISASDFQEARRQYQENKEKMTKLQFKEWWKKTKSEHEIEGKYVFSDGYVDEAKESWTGKLIVRIDIDNPSVEASVYDIELVMDEQEDRDRVVKLEKDDEIRFVGKVTLFDFVLGSLAVKMEEVELR